MAGTTAGTTTKASTPMRSIPGILATMLVSAVLGVATVTAIVTAVERGSDAPSRDSDQVLQYGTR